MLFSLLDYEVDPGLMSNIHDTINSIMQSMVVQDLTAWLSLCREVLTVSSEDSSAKPASSVQVKEEDDDDDGEGNDDEEFTMGDTEEVPIIQPRWPTRVFAAQCLRKIIEGTKKKSKLF